MKEVWTLEVCHTVFLRSCLKYLINNCYKIAGISEKMERISYLRLTSVHGLVDVTHAENVKREEPLLCEGSY